MSVRYLNKILAFSAMALMGMSIEAQAAPGPGSVGDLLTNVTKSFGSIPSLLSGCAYLLGIFFACVGLFKFKDHVDNPANTPLSAGVKRFIAGGMLLAAPFTASALKGSLIGTGANVIGGGKTHGVPGGSGVDQMIVGFIANIANPACYLLIAFAYISAIIFTISGLVRLTKTSQEGPRGPAGLGTIMTFVCAGALFSFGEMIGSFSSSLFGDATLSTYSVIDTTVIGADAAAQVAPVIDSLMVFIMIVGVIAFLRGWFVLRAFADGSREASVAQALTFLIGGALAINLGQLVNAIEATIGVNTITFN